MYIGLHVKYRCYSCQILMKPKFSRQTFEKCTNIKCHENTFRGSQVVPCGRTDGNDEAVSRFSQILRTRLKTQTLIPGIRNNSVRLWSFIRR